MSDAAHALRSRANAGPVFQRAVRVLDWLDRRSELRASRNPFAVFLLAVLAARTTEPNSLRADTKADLIVHLLTSFRDFHAIHALARAIDEVLPLPLALARKTWDRITARTESKTMPHLFIWERDALRKGRAEGRAEGRVEARIDDTLRVLEVRFGEIDARLRKRIRAIRDVARLDELLEAAIRAKSLVEFQRAARPRKD